MKNLAIIITHPIQYYVPVFKLLAQQIRLKVFYTWGSRGIDSKYDPGFCKNIEWDIPLLEGYDYEFLENTSKKPGSHHGKGIINPDIVFKIEQFKPNALLIYGYIYQSHFRVMRYFKGKTPIWFRGDSTLLDEKNRLKNIAKKIYLTWVYGYIDKAFYVGTNNKAYFKNYGVKDNQLVYAPHSIDNTRFTENRDKEAIALRKSLGISESDILILFAGKLEPKKNPELLLEAFRALIKERPFSSNVISNEYEKPVIGISPFRVVEMMNYKKVYLLFVGNGILENKLKSQISDLKSQILFIDFQNQTKMPIVYQACDIFCLPSQGPGETWGLAVNEAMAAGKAIIASDKVGCAIDLVKQGENGFIFPSNDSNTLKEKLVLLINQPGLIKNFGNQSQKIIQNWSFEEQVNQFIKVLNETD